MAVDSQYDSEAARLPVSLHPAFPGIVALWFAALLGLGASFCPRCCSIAWFPPPASPRSCPPPPLRLE